MIAENRNRESEFMTELSDISKEITQDYLKKTLDVIYSSQYKEVKIVKLLELMNLIFFIPQEEIRYDQLIAFHKTLSKIRETDEVSSPYILMDLEQLHEYIRRVYFVKKDRLYWGPCGKDYSIRYDANYKYWNITIAKYHYRSERNDNYKDAFEKAVKQYLHFGGKL